MRYLFYLIAVAVHLSAATVYYVPGYGESTSVGNYGGPTAISSSQPYSNQMLNGTAFVPLVEKAPYAGFAGLSGTQESPLSGALNNLTFLARASGGDFVVIANNYGVGSQTITDLNKADPYGNGYYAALLTGITAARNVATAAGNTLVVPGILLTLGGNDWASGCHGCPTSPSRGQDNFKALSVALQADLEADIKAITGQTQHVVFFFNQISFGQMANVGSAPYPGAGASLYTCPDTQLACVGDPTGQAAPLVPQAQYELARDYPSLFYFFGPSYHLTTADAYVHLDATSYNRWGATASRIMKTVLIDGIANQQGTIMPKQGQISYTGKVISVPVTTPNNLPLVIDTTTLPVPWRNGAADTHGMGFQVFQYNTGASDMNEIAISSVSVASQTVTITLSAAPSKAHVRLVYAFEGQRYAGPPVAGCAYNATTCVVNGVSRAVFPWQGNLHGNIRTATDFTDLHGEAIQYWMPTLNESVTNLSLTGPSTCKQGQICNYTATGGTSPYTYSLVSGSVGSIDSGTGAYIAPARVVPKQVINGCQAFPNNSIFNTRIDSLPVHPYNALWMSNIDLGINTIGAGMRLNGSTVLSTGAPTPMNFVYSTGLNGANFIFQPFPDRVSEEGAALTPPGMLPGDDNHILTTYRDTCMLQEVYKLYQTGAYAPYPASNSASGLLVSLESNRLPGYGYGTDAAGMPISPLLYHQDELVAAAAGNLDAIQHAIRLTLDTASIASGQHIWPAQADSSGSTCQGPPSGGHTWTITGNGTTTVTATTLHGFKLWPAGTTVVIDSVNYTVVSMSVPDPGVAGYYLSMVVSSPVSSGAHSMTQSDANCPPYGARFRLKASFTWPHQYSVTASGTTITAAAADPFPNNWYNHGFTVTIDGVVYTVTGGNAGGTYITLNTAAPSGSHTLVGPGNGYTPDCDTACQNVVQAVIRQQKTYGIILADTGSSWSGGSADIWNGSYSIARAEAQIACTVSNCAFDGLIGNSANYEIVDESSLQTTQTAAGADSTWVEARLGNGYVTPDSAAVVKVSDSAGAVAYYSTALQGVAVGVEHSNEIVMAGASPFQLHPWVTGTADGTFTCSLSPSGGSNGSITSGCLYSPSSTGAVFALTQTTVTVTSNADNTISKTIKLLIVPVSPDGKLHISLGKTVPAANYTDGQGIVWWNDQAQGLSLAMTPDDGSYPPSYGGPWANYTGTTGYATTAPGIYSMVMQNNNDHHFRIHVPNGLVTGSVLPANVGASARNMQAFSFDCNGVTVIPQTDVFDWTGGLYVVRPMTCSQVVTDGVLHMVVRLQGVNLSAYPGVCGVPCYREANQGNWVAGLVVGSNGVTVAYKKVTICTSGCDYPLTPTGLYYAMTDAAAYQDQTACIPYVIEGTGTLQMSGIPFPSKTCRQYVEIRSSQGGHFTPGQRYNPSTDDAYAFGIQGAKVVGNSSIFGTATGTRYWRFRNVNFFTDDTGGATYPVTGATWSGGIATLTMSGSPSIPSYSQISVNGITPMGFNIGNTANTGFGSIIGTSSNTVSYLVPTDPGAYSSGGTVTFLYQYILSAFIAWGGGFDANVMPDHLDVVQCGFRGDGDGDVTHAIVISGDNIRIVDSYFTGIQNPGTDAGALLTEHGDNLEVRNNYIGGGDETYGVGGSHVSAGTIPRFQYFIGNAIAKEPWIGMMSQASGPGSLPCFQGKWFHNTTTNVDYLCSATSGVWTAQPSLLTKSQRASKNLWECKICMGVRMIGNDFGMISGQTGQSAAGIVLNLVSQPPGGCSSDMPSPCLPAQNWTTIADINIQANHFHDGFSPFVMGYSDPTYKTCRAINVATGLPYTQPCYNYGHHNISFTHNLITNVSDERGYCPSFGSGPGGYCIVANDASETQYGATGPAVVGSSDYDIDFSNNTQTTSVFSANSGLTSGFGGNIGGTQDLSGMVHVRNNIGPIGALGFPGGASNPQNGCGMEAMFQLYGGAPDLRKNILTNDSPAGRTWQSFTTGTVTPACATAPVTTKSWPTDHAGGMSWKSILDTATFKVTNATYTSWGADGRPPGADIDLVNWKTAHAVDGAPAPALDYKIRSVIPTGSGASHGVRIYFTAPSTSNCTWELSPDPGGYASPVAVSSQLRNGRDGVAVWNDGTLTAGKAYWARLSCDGDRIETLVNGDRAMLITAP